MNISAPEISIIIPCYNTGEIIEEAFRSLEGQTFRDFEVILVNDGSKDNTLERLRSFEHSSGLDVVVIDKENGGASTARNVGIDAARGRYVVFLDSDDVLSPMFLQTLLDSVESGAVDISYCRLSRKLTEVLEPNHKIPAYIIQGPQETMHNLLYQMGEYGFYCYLYRRDLIERLELRFDKDTKYGEDREFIWKYICHIGSAAWINAPLYGYRINPNSVTGRKADWRKTDLLVCVKRIEQYLLNAGCSFYDEFRDYMYPRAVWAVAKTFAVSRSRKCYNRLLKEYDVRNAMFQIFKRSNQLYVRVLAVLYLISPAAFYRFLSLI